MILLSQAEGAPPEGGPPGFSMLFPLLLIGMLFYFLMFRPERRKQAAHRALLEGLKKNDRVVTVGGMYGVVMNVQRDADEVTLKVDEANNTKVRVTYSAIARVISDATEADKPSA